MTYKHLMIDIETLGTKSDSVILSIAAVNFDLDTGKTGATFNERIDIQSCLDFGLEIDSKTLQWWLNQPDNVSKVAFSGTLPLTKVLMDFWGFCKNLREDNLQVWGNSARFDLGLIENACNKTSMNIAWKYCNERDVRTLVSFNPQLRKNTPFIGNAHDPLDDCHHQIMYSSKIWNSLKPNTHA